MLEIQNLHFQHHSASTPAIRDLTLSVKPGTFLAVVGPSGSGKSTLLRAMNGLIPHFLGGKIAGRVLVNDQDTRIASTSDLSRHVGFVSQEPESQTVFDTVLDEIAFGPENLGLRADEIEERIQRAAETVRVEHLLQRDVSTLSGGERQRVVIAATLAMGSSILVLDEPLSQLDPWAGQEFLLTLQKLSRDRGVGVVIAEHRLDDLLRFCSHVLELNHGAAPLGQQTVVDAAGKLRYPPAPARLAQLLDWPGIPLTVTEAQALHIHHGPELQPFGAPQRELGPTVLDASEVTVRAGERLILDNVSLEIRSASVTAIIGPNGSGKTTLLRAIAGLQSLDAGIFEVRGAAKGSGSDSRRRNVTGFVPQHPAALFLGQSVQEEVEISLSGSGDDVNLDEHLGHFELDHLADRYPWDISGGERQRLALAIASASRPRLLLLDEPTRGMDHPAQERLKSTLEALRREGTAVVLSTHDMDLVASCADRAILLDSGHIRAVGSPHDVLALEPALMPYVSKVFGADWLTLEHVVQSLPGSTQRKQPSTRTGTLRQRELLD